MTGGGSHTEAATLSIRPLMNMRQVFAPAGGMTVSLTV